MPVCMCVCCVYMWLHKFMHDIAAARRFANSFLVLPALILWLAVAGNASGKWPGRAVQGEWGLGGAAGHKICTSLSLQKKKKTFEHQSAAKKTQNMQRAVPSKKRREMNFENVLILAPAAGPATAAAFCSCSRFSSPPPC